MSPELAAGTRWLIHTAIGGGALLLLGWLVVRRVRTISVRQRLGEAFVAAALLLSALSLAPAWIRIPLPSLHPTPAPPAEVAESAGPELPPGPAPAEELRPGVMPKVEAAPPEVALLPDEPVPEGPVNPPITKETTKASAESVAPPAGPGFPAVPWAAVVLGLYASGAVFFLGHWALGHLALWRIVRRTGPPPPRAGRLFREMAGPRPPRLLVSDRVRVPFSAGVWRPAVVLPAAVADAAPERELRWIFAHELTHIRRRDAWSAWLFGLGQGVYFFLPWFWALRRQARLCREYVADGEAAASAPADYAQFLLGWARPARLPAGAASVSGGSSDLFRRIAMLLNRSSPVAGRCPRGRVLPMVCGVLALAVLGAGLGVSAAPVPEKGAPKEEPRKEEPKKPAQVFPGFPELPEFPKGLPGLEEQQRRYMEELRKSQQRALELLRQRGLGGAMPEGFPAFPGAFAPGGESQGRLGVVIEVPDAAIVDQLELPEGQGLVVRRVADDSAAAKAGLKTHDILLEVDGKMVPSEPAKFVQMLGEIKADAKVDVVVLRKGRKETVKGLTLPEAKKGPAAAVGRAFPGLPAFPDFPKFPAAPGAAGGAGVSTSISRSNDEFTATRREGDLTIEVKGKVAGDKAEVEEIEVRDGKQADTYKEVAKVPERYRDKVQSLVEMAAKGKVRIGAPEKKPEDF